MIFLLSVFCTAVNESSWIFSVRKRLLLGPSPSWKCLLAISQDHNQWESLITKLPVGEKYSNYVFREAENHLDSPSARGAAAGWCRGRWSGVHGGGIRRITKRLILRLFTHMSIYHRSYMPARKHRTMIGLITDIRDWKSSGIMWLKSGSHDSHIFSLLTTNEVKSKEIDIVFIIHK